MSAPYCGLADAMEFPPRSVGCPAWDTRVAPSKEPQFITGLRLFLLEGTGASDGRF